WRQHNQGGNPLKQTPETVQTIRTTSVEGMNLPGWHIHFLSKDLTKGGHILKISGDDIKIKVNKLQAWKVLMPDDPDFSTWNLKEDLKSKTEAVEGATRK
ncbi:acetolactate decarboxylase, partial [Hoeflea sp. AS16]|uniref:acetolactate decarboxylase n=1 Tax=Hoeflea sp. AS16 TaxID=3135779 RepID=UPI00316FB4DC